MAQASITNFFNKRKRGVEETTKNSKVLILDEDDPTSIHQKQKFSYPVSKEHCGGVRNLIYEVRPEKQRESSKQTQEKGSSRLVGCDKPTLSKGASRKQTSKKKAKVSKAFSNTSKGIGDIRLAFKLKDLNDASSSSKPIELNASEEKQNVVSGTTPIFENRVAFELLGVLSPKEKKMDEQKESDQSSVSETSDARRELGLMTPKRIIQQKQKDISMNEIRQKVCRSSRLAELRETIKKFSQKDEELKQLETERKKLDAQSPQLKKFTSIDLVVDVSPRKSAVSSPVKGSPLKSLLMSPLKSPLMSPLKSPLASPLKSPLTSPTKLPAYQRLGYLAQPGVPDLTLPFTYRTLQEIFRCSDTVTSMFYNRREVVTFQKLKGAVQEMSRRNFMERHLGQIKRVNPKAYAFSQEKRNVFGSVRAKYELVVTPIIEQLTAEVLKESNGSSYPLMTPSVLVERRENFHNCLLEIVKDYHENFLKTLEPPVILPRSKLSRWHPDFNLEQVPPVEPDELPQPPHQETYSTAKDVLSRAKDLFSCNQRMEKALQKVSEQKEMPAETVTSNCEAKNESATSALLKGVPKALLEKIRAKQAARALMAMMRTPDEDREALKLMRLPEITRVLRNIFVAEKKNVLKLETAITKLESSYRESLSRGELKQHINLLIKVVPGWLEIHHVRQCDYLKLSRNCDVSAVIKKLEDMSVEKNQNL